MDNDEDQHSPGWSASLFVQTTEDVARAVAAAAAAATAARSPRPSVVFSSKEDSGGHLRKFQRQVSRVLKGLSHPPEETRRMYNPEVLTSQKRQWASFQSQYLDHRILKEPSRLFESMVVVGLHPDCDIQMLQRQYFGRKSEGSGRFRNALGGQYHSRVEPNLEPQVLFVYPPDKELPLKYKDLLSFCFPGGLEVRAVEKTPSMSELNEILLGQEHLKQSDMSFVFRLQVADDSTLYGCCVLVDEMVQKPSRLISMISNSQPFRSPFSRHNLTTRRCYCILSRLPFFDLHFGVLNSIFTEERLEWLTKSIHDLDFDSSFENDKEERIEEKTGGTSITLEACHLPNGTAETAYLSSNVSVTGRAIDDGLSNRMVETAEGSSIESVGGKVVDNDFPHIIEDASQLSTDVSVSGKAIGNDTSHVGHQFLQVDSVLSVKVNDVTVVPMKPEIGKLSTKEESLVATDSSKAYDTSVDDIARKKTAYSDQQSMNDSVTERAINDHLPNGTADIAQLTMNGTVIGRAVEDDLPNRTGVTTQLSTDNSVCGRAINEETSHVQYQSLQSDSLSSDEGVNHDAVIPIDPETEKLSTKNEFAVSTHSSNGCDTSVDDIATNGKVVINRGVEIDQLSTKNSDSVKVIDHDFPNGTPEFAQPTINNSVTGRAIDDHFTSVTAEAAQLSINNSISGRSVDDNATQAEHQFLQVDSRWLEKDVNNDAFVPTDAESEQLSTKNETLVSDDSSKPCDTTADDLVANRQQTPMQIPSAILPLLRYQHYESSDSSSSFQGSPSDDRNFRSDFDSGETEEASSSGQEDSAGHSEILEWAKANNLGSLQIICEYYQLSLPARGSTIKFHPLDHLHPLEFHRPDETIDLTSCHTSLELAEAHSALVAEEEATALSVWAVASICGSLRLEHVLTIFAGALLEKQIVFVCSNLGILSASVLSIIPLIRPYQWQSLLMPVLPNDMLDFLDAPVPYVVGVKNKTAEVQSKSSNVILVDANKNQVKTSSIPHLPQHKELYSALSPYHAQLVGESYLGRKRPIYNCTEVQVEAAKGFLRVLRSYLDSLCSNLRSHTITNVQSNDDKVSLLLKESFIESFPSRDRAFMKLFVDTQLFSVHTDRVLSFFQKD